MDFSGIMWAITESWNVKPIKPIFLVTLMQSCYSLQYLCRRMFKIDCPLHVPNPSVLCTNLLVIDSKFLYLNCLCMQRKFQFRIINTYMCYGSNVFCTCIIFHNFHFDFCQINQNVVITHLNESIGNISFIHPLDEIFIFK